LHSVLLNRTRVWTGYRGRPRRSIRGLGDVGGAFASRLCCLSRSQTERNDQQGSSSFGCLVGRTKHQCSSLYHPPVVAAPFIINVDSKDEQEGIADPAAELIDLIEPLTRSPTWEWPGMGIVRRGRTNDEPVNRVVQNGSHAPGYILLPFLPLVNRSRSRENECYNYSLVVVPPVALVHQGVSRSATPVLAKTWSWIQRQNRPSLITFGHNLGHGLMLHCYLNQFIF